MTAIGRVEAPDTGRSVTNNDNAHSEKEGVNHENESRIVHLSQIFEGLAVPQSAAEKPPAPGNWPELLERIRYAAHYVREVEDRLQQHDFRIQEILEQLRGGLEAARAQANAAEQHTRDVQARANRLIKAAEERAQLAEERATVAESWLRKVAEAIDTEFLLEPAGAEAGSAKLRPSSSR